MSSVAVSLQHVSKHYPLTQAESRPYSTLSGTLGELFSLDRDRAGKTASVQVPALEDVSLTISAGERVGVIGHNGAGKSTLLKLISRITQPSAGRIVLRGRVATLLEVGTGFHPELTGRENVFLNGAILGMKNWEIRERFDEIVSFSGVTQYIDMPVKKYSSGMYMRLAFAVAAHLEPDILVVDEVLAVGDAEFQEKCLGKLEEVSRQFGRTVIFVSHDLEAVHRLCHRAVLFERARILLDGDAGSVIERYLHVPASKLRASFPATPDLPSITGVVLNEDKLKSGCFELEVSFQSPYPLNPPIVGFVIYNARRTPVMGSNPRIHGEGFKVQAVTRGSCIASMEQMYLHTGQYRVDLWLGDQNEDFDHKRDALIFEYKNPRLIHAGHDPMYLGSVDHPARWEIRTE